MTVQLVSTQAQPAYFKSPQALRWSLGVLVGCLVFFLLLHNPYWSRGGDSDVYLAIARNVASGKGLTFNNNPVVVVPPLWPWVLGGVMKLTSSFALLKLVPITCMTLSMVCWHRIGLRYVSPNISAAAVALATMLSQVFMLALWFHTEAFYCLVGSLSILVAMQINEGRRFWWRAMLLVILCVATVLTRWSGVMWWALVAAALLRGDWFSPFNRRRAVAYVSLVAVLASFLLMRVLLAAPQERIKLDYDLSLSVQYEVVNHPQTLLGWAQRALALGSWFGATLWQAARDWELLRPLSLLTGLMVAALLTWRMICDVRKKDWLLLAMLAHIALLAMDWPSVVARYVVPMTPLILLGMLRILIDNDGCWPTKPAWERLRFWGLRAFVLSIIICNGVFYIVEVYIARQPDYYSHYQAGLNDNLIDIVKYLNDRHVPQSQIVMSRKDVNGNRARITNGWIRAYNVLSGKSVRSLPQPLENQVVFDPGNTEALKPSDPKVLQWLQSQGVRYYLYRGVSRVSWHFEAGKERGLGRWRLYEIRDGAAEEIATTEQHDWPRHLPLLSPDE